MNKIKELIKLLHQKEVQANRSIYICEFANDDYVIFTKSESTGQIMLPMDLVLEWVQAYDFGLIKLSMSAREMRNIVSAQSVWATYHHGFETQLCAIVHAWSNRLIKPS